MRIRDVRPDDHLEVLALSERLSTGVATWRDSRRVLTAATRWLRESLADPATAVFVADDPKHGIVGVGSVTTRTHFTGESDAYIGELVVASGHERRGVGRRLVTQMEGWATERGHRCITLETGSANLGARAFYTALGYAEEEVTMTRVLPPGRTNIGARQTRAR